MRFFKNRHDPDYKTFLTKLLDLEDAEGIIKTAISIENPKKHNGIEYHKCIRIDFCGIAASTLFKKDNLNLEVANKFLTVFSNLEKINKLGIFVKVRFLFAYLYSDFSFSLIKAEKSSKRATMKDPTFSPDFDLEEELTEEEFFSSAAYRNQTKSLEQIQKLADSFKLFENNSVNSIQVRFTPISLNLCSLIINDSSLSDPYLYSREDITRESLANLYPLVSLNGRDDKLEFESVLDNFRYLWNHQTTLYCKDATHYIVNEKESLKKIRKPFDLTFESKSKRLRDLEKTIINSDEEKTPDRKIKQWRFLLKQMVLHSTKIFQENNSSESIFIACSWRPDITGDKTPNKYALELETYLREDFSSAIEIKLVVTGPGEGLFDKIYTFLRQSTLGIILITKDIESLDGKFYSKPNIYYEHGFLVSHLDARRTSRVIALVKNGSTPPTNADDRGYINFDADKLALRYGKIISWLKERCETVGKDQIENAVRNHKKRLNQMVIDSMIHKAVYEQLLVELEGILKD